MKLYLLFKSLGTVFTLALIIGLAGCTTYLEEPTPAELVSNSPQPIGGWKQDTRLPTGAYESSPAASAISPYIGRPLSGATQAISTEAYEGSILRFQSEYTKVKSPRIAIYFNRVLSDEVREWRTQSRDVVAGIGEKVIVGGGPTTVTTEGTVIEAESGIRAEGASDKERGVVAYSQSYIEQQKRQNLEDLWMWRFEDHFIQPFLKAGAKMVDRATILRLTAAKSTETEKVNKFNISSVKGLEMQALKEHAEILVEILVTRDASSPSGYAFRAVAKEITTGVLIGSVSKTGRDYRYEKAYEVVASPSGYELQKGSSALILENISEELAIDLMNSIASFWQK